MASSVLRHLRPKTKKKGKMDSSFLSSPQPYSPAESDGWSETIGHDDSHTSTTATSVTSSPSPSRSKPGEHYALPSPLSSQSPQPQPEPQEDFPLCNKCLSPVSPSDTNPDIPALTCGHTTCTACIRTSAIHSIISAVQGADFAPAQCCADKTFPLATIGHATSHIEFVAYRERLVEIKTPPERRVYCAEEECGMFISEACWSGRSGCCPLCGARTCLGCGRRGHMGVCKGEGGFRERPGKVREWLRGVE